jgi:hypothetical protein
MVAAWPLKPGCGLRPPVLRSRFLLFFMSNRGDSACHVDVIIIHIKSKKHGRIHFNFPPR